MSVDRLKRDLLNKLINARIDLAAYLQLRKAKGYMSVSESEHLRDNLFELCNFMREKAPALQANYGESEEVALRRAAEGCGAEISIERTAGTPFFFARLRRRHALFAGGILCAALLLVNSLFIWDFEVTGNETVPTETILHALREHGVHRGTFIYSFRSQDICNRVLPELKDLCWVAVNVRGCKAYVQVRERVRAPERVNESEPTNVIAAKPGLITKVRALDGEKRVLPGTSVQQGQLLIAGVVDTGGTEKPSVTTRFLAGKGEVWARTWYDLTVRVPLTYEKKVYTGKEKRSHTLIWGENRLKIGAKGSSICNVDCDKIKNQTQWTLFGLFALPVTWETETLLPYELEIAARSRADAEAQGKDVLETYLAALLGETGSVTQRRFSTAAEGDTLVVTLSAECEEQIGKEVPIAVSEG